MTEKFRSCFIKNDQCSEKFKNAHILSQSATMRLVNGSTTSGLQVVHLGSKIDDKFIPQPIGWKKASAHLCFCHDHDDEIFKPIENGNRLDFQNNEHLFLHSLRSFAYTYFKKLEEHQLKLNLVKPIEELRKSILGIFTEDTVSKEDDLDYRIRMHLYAYESVREELLEILESKDYSKLEFRKAQINYRMPFASAGVLMAKIFDDSGRKWTFLNLDEHAPIIKRPAIILTVLPVESGQTIIIVAALKSDANAVFSLERFDRLDGEQLRRAISALMIQANKENTYFNPKLWNYIQHRGYSKNIIEELNKPRGLDLLVDDVELSSVDLFSHEFSCNSLGII